MGLRPAHCYRGVDKPAYTRIAVTKHDKNFIGTNPGLRTRQFNMGNPRRPYTHIVELLCDAPGIQMRDNAIESVRLSINRNLVENVGKDNFFMKLRIYPFHIMRENKLAQGAGADRVSSGMKHAFGKPIGKAARLRMGQRIFSVLCDADKTEIVRKGMLYASPKVGFPVRVIIHEDVKSIGTVPKKAREDKIAAALAAAAEAEATGKTAEKGAAKAGDKKEAAGKDAKAAPAKPAAKKK